MASGQSPPVGREAHFSSDILVSGTEPEAQSFAAYTASIDTLSILRVIRGDWTIPVRFATRGWKGL